MPLHRVGSGEYLLLFAAYEEPASRSVRLFSFRSLFIESDNNSGGRGGSTASCAAKNLASLLWVGEGNKFCLQQAKQKTTRRGERRRRRMKPTAAVPQTCQRSQRHDVSYFRAVLAAAITVSKTWQYEAIACRRRRVFLVYGAYLPVYTLDGTIFPAVRQAKKMPCSSLACRVRSVHNVQR